MINIIVRPPHVKVICPTASKMPVTLNSGFSMPSWFDLLSLDPAGKEDEAGIKAAQQVVETLIEQEVQAGLPSDRIMIGGFSQGGALSLFSALQSRHRLAGVAARIHGPCGACRPSSTAGGCIAGVQYEIGQLWQAGMRPVL